MKRVNPAIPIPSGPRRRGSCITVLTALLLLAAPGAALGDGDAQEAEARARAHFREGQIHFDLARFEEALASFGKAYEALPLPAFLFNIGQCHRALGDHARAIHFFRGYLRGTPDATNREAVEKLIAESEAALARAPADPDPAVGIEGAAVDEDPLTKHEPAPPDAVDVAPVPPPGEARPPLYGRWWFWATIGVVAAGGTAAAVAASSGRNELPEGSLGVVDWR
jgi:tetratricopeptide (TPR) repeat protein